MEERARIDIRIPPLTGLDGTRAVMDRQTSR